MPTDGSSSDRFSRRDLLKGIGALGAGSTLAATGEDVFDPTDALASSGDVHLPTDVVKEYYYPTADRNAIPLAVTRGLSQTNLRVVPADSTWRTQCDGKPGIYHRFTTAGYFRGVKGASLDISIDDQTCGNLSLTPYYKWDGYRTGSSVTGQGSLPSTEAELTEQVDRFYDSTFEADEPRDYDSFFEAAGLLTSALSLTPLSVPGLALAGAVLTVREFAELLTQSKPDVYSRDETSLDLSLRERDDDNHRFYWVDFAVVVPSGESATLSVEQSVETRMDVPTPDDQTFTVDLPSIHHASDLATVSTPTIDVEGAPITASASGLSADLTGSLPEDYFEAPEWNVGGTGTEVSHQFDREGAYPVSFTAEQSSDATGETGFEYTATRPLVLGDPPFEGIVTASIDGPREATTDESVTFDATASSTNGDVVSHEWTVHRIGTRSGVETPVDRSGSGPPGSLRTELQTGEYAVVLSVTDAAGNRTRTSHSLTVSDPQYETPTVSIDGRSEVPEDEPETFTGTADSNNGDVDRHVWKVFDVASQNASEPIRGSYGDGLPDDFRVDLSAGIYELQLRVVDDVGKRAVASHRLTVTEVGYDGATASIDAPQEVSPGTTATFDGSASSTDGAIASHRWSLLRSDPISGVQRIDDSTRTGEPGTYERAVEPGDYLIALEVEDDAGATARASEPFTVPLDPTIEGPDTVEVGDQATFGFSVARADWVGSWEWTAPVQSDEAEVTPTFDESGETTIELELTDRTGDTVTPTKTVTVEDYGKPSVDFTGPESIIVDETATFDGTASSPNGEITWHEWKVVEGQKNTGSESVESDDGNGPPGSFRFDHDQGSYNVWLTVEDEVGKRNSYSASFDIEYGEPTADFSGPSEIDADETATFDGSASSPNGGITWHEWEVIERQDGTGQDSFVPDSGDGPPGSLRFEFGRGLYKVKLKVEDEAGKRASHSQSLEVIGVPSVYITQAPESANLYELVEFDGTMDGGNGSVDSHRWLVEYELNGTWIKQYDDPSTVGISPFTMSEDEPGTYRITLTATDSKGRSDDDSVTLPVVDPDSGARSP